MFEDPPCGIMYGRRAQLPGNINLLINQSIEPDSFVPSVSMLGAFWSLPSGRSMSKINKLSINQWINLWNNARNRPGNKSCRCAYWASIVCEECFHLFVWPEILIDQSTNNVPEFDAGFRHNFDNVDHISTPERFDMPLPVHICHCWSYCHSIRLIRVNLKN